MTIAAAALAVAAIGTGVATYGAVSQGEAASRNAKFQSQIAANNAQIAEQNAQRALQAGQTRAEVEGRKASARKAQIRAAIAANGIDVNSGSALDVQEGEAETGKFNQLSELNKAALEAYGYRTQGSNFQAESTLRGMEGDQAETAGILGGASSLLGGASSLGFKWAGIGGGGSSKLPDMGDV